MAVLMCLMLVSSGWYRTPLSREGVCGLLHVKGFPWTSPVGHILLLVPRFDREFVTTLKWLLYFGWQNKPSSGTMEIYIGTYAYIADKYLRNSRTTLN